MAPWNYNGNEQLFAMSEFPSNTVDWVLVEAINSVTTIVERKAGIMLADGTVVDASDPDLDGVMFDNLVDGQSYYVIVRHRNHLAAVSAEPVAYQNFSLNYDFSLIANRAMFGRTTIDWRWTLCLALRRLLLPMASLPPPTLTCLTMRWEPAAST